MKRKSGRMEREVRGFFTTSSHPHFLLLLKLPPLPSLHRSNKEPSPLR